MRRSLVVHTVGTSTQMPTTRHQPPSKTPSARARALLRRVGVAATRDLAQQGLTRTEIRRLAANGVLEQVARGLYRLPENTPTELHDLAIASRKSPRGTICLISALRLHDLTTQAAHEVWIALPHKARAPRLKYPLLRIIRMSGASLDHGVEQRTIEGIPVRVYSAAKTVADCFKFRNRIGLDVAIEALRDYVRKHRRRTDDLYRAATACRVERVMRPYLESMV